MGRNFVFEQAQTCSGFNPVIVIKIFSQDVDLDLNKQTNNKYKQYTQLNRPPRRVPLLEQELLTIPEHLISPLVFSGVHVADL